MHSVIPICLHDHKSKELRYLNWYEDLDYTDLAWNHAGRDQNTHPMTTLLKKMSENKPPLSKSE